jgi:GAF domain-containing protein
MDDRSATEELARVSRTLRTICAGNRTLLRATDEIELLNAMCRVVVETGGYRMAFVGYAQDDPQKSVVHVAGFGADAAFLEVVPSTWADNEFGQTAIATSIRTGKPSVARNILKEPAFASLPRLREQVRANGCSAVTALPLEVEGRIIGAMTVLAAEPEAFGPAEVELLSELGSDLGYGIASLRIRARHRNAEATIKRLAFYDELTGPAEPHPAHAGTRTHARAGQRRQDPCTGAAPRAEPLQRNQPGARLCLRRPALACAGQPGPRGLARASRLCPAWRG